jgi:hypothetical protein
MAASIGAEAAGLAVDKAEQRRIIAGTPERSSHPLKYSSDQRSWVSFWAPGPPRGEGGHELLAKAIGDFMRLYPRPALTSKAVPN